MPASSRRGISSCTSGALSTSCRDHAPAVATMARRSSAAHRGRGIRAPTRRPGAPKTFSDCAIETALTLRLVFRVPLRQAEGFLRSVLSLMGVDLAAPDHTTLSRRSQSLAVAFRRLPSRGPIHLIVDSTGLSIVGEGEWAAVNHGGRGHRGWKTLHLAVDRVGVIVAHACSGNGSPRSSRQRPARDNRIGGSQAQRAALIGAANNAIVSQWEARTRVPPLVRHRIVGLGCDAT